jgi:serine/threonine protein kinase
MQIRLHQKINSQSLFYGIIKLYGITQDPETKNYVMILDYAENGSLRNYLNARYNELSWYNKIGCLYNIAFGLENIHDNEIIHRDLHVGNISTDYSGNYITDMWLCKPADYYSSEYIKKQYIWRFTLYSSRNFARTKL